MKAIVLFAILISQNASAFYAKCSLKFEDSLASYTLRQHGVLEPRDAKDYEAYLGLVNFHQVECKTRKGEILTGEVESFGAGLMMGFGNFTLTCPLQTEKRLMKRLNEGKTARIFTAEAQAVLLLLGVKLGVGFGHHGNPCVVANIPVARLGNDESSGFAGIGAEVGIHAIRFKK